MKKTQRSWNSTLRRESPKKHQEKRETDGPRRAYVEAHWTCQVCHKREATDCHEIVRGGSRALAVRHQCCWLALCRECHEAVDDYSVWPVSRQLALKLLADTANFDLATVNKLRGRGENAITLADVVSWLTLNAAIGRRV